MGYLSELRSDWLIYSEEATKVGVADSVLLLRYFFAWRRSLRPNASPTVDRMPWFTFPAIDALKRRVGAQTRVFEYGAGGSTLFFLDRGAELITVDHDSRWLEEVSGRIDSNTKKRWSKRLVGPENDLSAATNAFDDPDGYVSQDASLSGLSLRSYAKAIDGFPDGYFDIVIVDGRARPSCAKHARPKVKPGGILVLDNAERDYYWRIGSDLTNDGWRGASYLAPGPYIRYFWMTSIFQKTGET